MQKKARFFLSGILLLLFVLAVWGYGLYSKKHENARNFKPDITINATDLYNLYAANEQEADKKFLNKIIAVKGRISQIITNNNTKFLLLDKNSSGGVNCQLSNEDKNNLPLPEDSIITIKGRCTGFLMDVNLVDCVRE